MLKESEQKVLEAFSAALNEKSLQWQTMPESKIWREIYNISIQHKIFPMVMDAVGNHKCLNIKVTSEKRYHYYTERARNEILTQAQRSADFLLFYDYLIHKGLKPLVMKGIVCRSLYPHPEHRSSADEDLLISQEDFAACHQAIIEYGLELVNPAEDIWKAHEVSYQNKDSLLYIEVHKQMFPPESPVFGKWNRLFSKCTDKYLRMNIYGVDFYTLNYTDHLLYLMLHAFKHFLYGGFGICQISDIVLFSEKYSSQVNWNMIKDILSDVHAIFFTRAVYKIGSVHLSLPMPEEILKDENLTEIDELPLLCDVMSGGIYGASTPGRQHSSNMTLFAVEKTVKGKHLHISALIHAVFLPRKNLEHRYPYLKKVPLLLPLAWWQRILQYYIDTRKRQKETGIHNQLTEGMRLGTQRIELLKEYKII